MATADGPLVGIQMDFGPQIAVQGTVEEVQDLLNGGDQFVAFVGLQGEQVVINRDRALIFSEATISRAPDIAIPQPQILVPHHGG